MVLGLYMNTLASVSQISCARMGAVWMSTPGRMATNSSPP